VVHGPCPAPSSRSHTFVWKKKTWETCPPHDRGETAYGNAEAMGAQVSVPRGCCTARRAGDAPILPWGASQRRTRSSCAELENARRQSQERHLDPRAARGAPRTHERLRQWYAHKKHLCVACGERHRLTHMPACTILSRSADFLCLQYAYYQNKSKRKQTRSSYNGARRITPIEKKTPPGHQPIFAKPSPLPIWLAESVIYPVPYPDMELP
jgi:hypothetical protein